MNVLIACEFSGRVRNAFARRGHFVVSSDLLPSDSPGLHYQGDVRDILTWPWDLMIAHPPCTHLAISGARWWPGKLQEQRDAIAFVHALWNTAIPRVVIENPIGKLSTAWRKPDQVIHPWQFGHGETKATCLWIRGCPPPSTYRRCRRAHGARSYDARQQRPMETTIDYVPGHCGRNGRTMERK